MKTWLSLGVASLLAALLTTGGCRKKAPPARPDDAMITVTVTGAVNHEGNFEKGGFLVGKRPVDGKDPNGLAAALRAEKSALAAKGHTPWVRILIHSSTPYGVVRRIVSAAAAAGTRDLALACVTEDEPRPKGIGFSVPAGSTSAPANPVELRIWPRPDVAEVLYRITGVDETFATARAVRAALASRKAAPGEAPGICIRPADAVTADLVAEALAEVRRAGSEAIRFTGEPMRDKAPEPPKVPAAASQPEDDDGNEPVPTGARPASSFAGAKGEAYNVVFLIDRSGSMVTDFDSVRRELLASVEALKPKQYFHVVFFGGRRPKENPTRKLVRATKANKRAAKAFIETIASSGVTQPIPAINRCFDVLKKARKSRPGKIVYLLTDGDFAGEKRFTDNKAVLAAIRARNADKKAVIHTLLYGKSSAEGEKVLKAIAAENAGQYRFVKRPG